MNEISIFELGVEDTQPVPKKPEVFPKVTQKTPSPKPVEVVMVQGDWTIHFGTDTFKVADFIEEDIPEGGISLEEVRSGMEKVFFQFTQSRTKWDVGATRCLISK